MTATTIIVPRRRARAEANTGTLRRELESAAALQQRLLPRMPRTIGNVQVAALSLPAGSLAGDWYDIVAQADGCVALGLGDVSGKGASAALLAARVSTELAAAAREGVRPPAMLARANSRLCACHLTGEFASAIQITVDRSGERVCVANAGHMPPMLREGDNVRTLGLTSAGPALGVVENVQYWSAEYRLEPGAALLIYSDGISEARDRRGRLFGETRIARLFRCAPAKPHGVIQRLFDAVSGFTGGGVQDDATALCLTRTA